MNLLQHEREIHGDNFGNTHSPVLLSYLELHIAVDTTGCPRWNSKLLLALLLIISYN